MEEIENRFEIIRIAARLADYETIETQIKRLRNMSTDKHLHEILLDLENRNFRQALYSMQDYAESLRDDFFSPSLSDREKVPETQSIPRQAPSPQFARREVSSSVEQDLFSSPEPTPSPVQTQGAERMLGLEEMLQMTRESASTPRQYTQTTLKKVEPKLQQAEMTQDVFEPKPTQPMVAPSAPHSPEQDPLFTLDQDIAIVDDHEVKESEQEKETVIEEIPATETLDMTPLFGEVDDLDDDFLSFPPLEEETALAPEEDSLDVPAEPEDIFNQGVFDLEEEVPPIPPTPQEDKQTASEKAPVVPTVIPKQHEEKMRLRETPEQPIKHEVISEPEPEKSISDDAEATEPQGPRRWEIEPELDEELYEKFAYMGQKFRNMMHQYPQLEEHENGVIEEVRDFIHMVSTRDYVESQVEAVVARYQEFKEQGNLAEAAQMLIAAATTESTFAQFMLARELFKGEVLKQDYPESFTQINRLAEEDYPEAICDLGQLYEYGIGIDKNKRHALLLYEEAAEMGVERAKGHYDRLKNSNPIQSIKSLTTSLLRKKK